MEITFLLILHSSSKQHQRETGRAAQNAVPEATMKLREGRAVLECARLRLRRAQLEAKGGNGKTEENSTAVGRSREMEPARERRGPTRGTAHSRAMNQTAGHVSPRRGSTGQGPPTPVHDWSRRKEVGVHLLGGIQTNHVSILVPDIWGESYKYARPHNYQGRDPGLGRRPRAGRG